MKHKDGIRPLIPKLVSWTISKGVTLNSAIGNPPKAEGFGTGKIKNFHTFHRT